MLMARKRIAVTACMSILAGVDDGDGEDHDDKRISQDYSRFFTLPMYVQDTTSQNGPEKKRSSKKLSQPILLGYPVRNDPYNPYKAPT